MKYNIRDGIIRFKAGDAVVTPMGTFETVACCDLHGCTLVNGERYAPERLEPSAITQDIELYAHISQSADGCELSIGRDVPGQASHGAANWVGTFNSCVDAIRYAQRRGVYSSRITVFIP